jgi:hypothetical protein
LTAALVDGRWRDQSEVRNSVKSDGSDTVLARKRPFDARNGPRLSQKDGAKHGLFGAFLKTDI